MWYRTRTVVHVLQTVTVGTGVPSANGMYRSLQYLPSSPPPSPPPSPSVCGERTSQHIWICGALVGKNVCYNVFQQFFPFGFSVSKLRLACRCCWKKILLFLIIKAHFAKLVSTERFVFVFLFFFSKTWTTTSDVNLNVSSLNLIRSSLRIVWIQPSEALYRAQCM